MTARANLGMNSGGELAPVLFDSFFLVLVAVSAFWAGFRGVRRGYSRLWIGLCGGAIPLGLVTFLFLVTFVTTGRSDFDELLAWEAVVKIGSCFVLAILSSLAAREALMRYISYERR